MSGRLLRRLAVLAAAWTVSLGTAFAQAPVLSAPTVTNSAAPFTVAFTWSATSGATGYRFDAGVTPGSYVYSQTLSAVTTLTLSNVVPAGTFYVRVVALTAGGDVPSAEVSFQAPAPPAAPTNLIVARNGTGVAAYWNAGAGGGTALGYRLQVGTSPGTSLASFPTATPTWSIGGGVPLNTYYFRAVAFNSAGESAPSNEVTVVMPAGGACDSAPPVTFSSFSFSGYVSVSWTPIAGVSQYLVSGAVNGNVVATDLPFAANATAIRGTFGLGTYDITVKSQFACGGTPASASVRVVNDGAPPAGPRTPDPAPGQLLPVPGYGKSVVDALAAARPDLVNASCRETGGNNRFMFEVVRELRKRDTRWGLNWKRGNAGDLSQDIVSYNVSALPDEGATTGPTTATFNIRIFDMIGGHCGPRPGPNWEDVTGKTIDPGRTRAVWTLLPYLQAGYTP